MAAAGVAQETHHTSDHPIGWRRYLYSTNHKDIGTMYLVFALLAGIIGGALSIGMRMEVPASAPAPNFLDAGPTNSDR